MNKGQNVPGVDNRKNSLRTRWKNIVIVFLICILVALPLIYYLDYINIEGLPDGRYYHYHYEVRISNVSSKFSIILPVAILENGSILPHIDF
jgi:hypothetical protein